MKSIVRITKQGKVKEVNPTSLVASLELDEVDTKVACIQALIPVGLAAVYEELTKELTRLAGPKHSRTGGLPGVVRWCRQRGSVYLADQKVPITYQRARNRLIRQEVPLPIYQRLQVPREADAGLFRKILLGLSCRDYEPCAEAVPTAFGLSAFSVSRRFIRASARQLQQLCERRLEGYDIVAVILDGKTFAEDGMVIAVGVTVTEEKVILGFVQTATENERVCAAFLRALVERGLQVAQGLLCVLWGEGTAEGYPDRLRRPSAGAALSGISGRMSWPTCPRPSRRHGVGGSRPRMSNRPMPWRRLPCSGCGRNSRG